MLSKRSHRFNRCDAPAKNLDGGEGHPRSHEKTDFLIEEFDPGILWDEFGIQSDVVVRLIYQLFLWDFFLI